MSGPVEMRAFVVAAFVPGSVEARRHPPVEPVPPLDADAEVAKLRLVREPMLAHVRQQARLGDPADQPARAHMARNGHLVELARAVLAARHVGARAQPPAVLQRVLVFPAGPDRDADTGFGLVLRLKDKRKPSDRGVEHDRLLVRPAGDIAVRRQRHAEAQAPALSRPHLRQEPVDVEHHRRRRLAGQHLLEMPRRQRVLALQEESPGKLQADANQAGVRDQHGAEGRDGLVQQRLACVVGNIRPPCSSDGREAVEEERVRLDRIRLEQRAQYCQRVYEPADIDQRPCVSTPE